MKYPDSTSYYNQIKLENDLKKYIEKIAKDELGYVGDGERIFINVAGE